MKKKKHTVITSKFKNPEPCLLSRKAVAEMLSLSVPTVKRYQQQGLIKPIILNSRLVRYRYEEILAFIKQAAAWYCRSSFPPCRSWKRTDHENPLPKDCLAKRAEKLFRWALKMCHGPRFVLHSPLPPSITNALQPIPVSPIYFPQYSEGFLGPVLRTLHGKRQHREWWQWCRLLSV